jgi:hypothetical protein
MRVSRALQPKPNSREVVFRRDRGNQPRVLKTKRRVGNEVWTIHVLTNVYRGRSGLQRLTRTTLVRRTLETNAGAFYHVRVRGYPQRSFKVPSRQLIDAFFSGRSREACTLYIPLTSKAGISFPFWRYEVGRQSPPKGGAAPRPGKKPSAKKPSARKPSAKKPSKRAAAPARTARRKK